MKRTLWFWFFLAVYPGTGIAYLNPFVSLAQCNQARYDMSHSLPGIKVSVCSIQ